MITNKDNKLEKDMKYVLKVVEEQNDRLGYFKLVKRVQQEIGSDRKYAQDLVDKAEGKLIRRNGEYSDFINTYSLKNKFARVSR